MYVLYSANAELRLRLNPFAQQKLYEEATGKNSIEHGFRGTALSSAPPPPSAAQTAAAAAATASGMGAPSSPAAAAASTTSTSLPATPVAAAAASAAPVVDDSLTVPASQVEGASAVPPVSPTVSELEEKDCPDHASQPPSSPAAAAAAVTLADPSPTESAQTGAVADSATAMELDDEPHSNVTATAGVDDTVPAVADAVDADADAVLDPVAASTAAPQVDAPMLDALDASIDSAGPSLATATVHSSKVPPPQLPAITPQARAEAVAQNQHELANSRARACAITIDDEDDQGAIQSDEHKETHADDTEQPQAEATMPTEEEAAKGAEEEEPAASPTSDKLMAVHTRRRRSNNT